VEGNFIPLEMMETVHMRLRYSIGVKQHRQDSKISTMKEWQAEAEHHLCCIAPALGKQNFPTVLQYFLGNKNTSRETW
jgi:hypothetical protein